MNLIRRNSFDNNSRMLRNYCIISGCLACVIMLIFYLFHENTLLFGDATVLRMDLYHQYGPLYSELYDRITGGNSLIYSWTSGLGNSFLGNFLNYCSSPFAIVMLICGHQNMPEAIAIMMLLKAVLASVSFTYFINKSTKTVHPASIGFGLLYAFCGYFVAYSWNIMWMDAVAVFPLVMLGIEKIINEKRPVLYIIVLTYTMYTNYYMAFMVCMLSVLYFLFYYFSNYTLLERYEKEQKKETKSQYAAGLVVKEELSDTVPFEEASVTVPFEEASETVPIKEAEITDAETVHTMVPDQLQAEEYAEQITPADIPVPENESQHVRMKPAKGLFRILVSGTIFGMASLLSFMLAAVVLIPLYYCLKACSATGSPFPTTLTIYYNIFDFLANHLPSLEPTIRSSGDVVLPNIYSGVATVLLLPAFFISDKIKSRKKLMALFFLGIFYLSFSINYLNFIWHGLHYPNDLPYRFSFAYSFILLYLAYQALLHITDFSRKYFVVTGFAALIFVVITEKVGSQNVSDTTVILSIVFILIYVILAGLISSSSFTKKNLQYLLIFFIIVEIACADTSHLIMSQPKDSYTSDYQSYIDISNQIESSEDELFYRTELSKLRTRMDPCWYGYNGISVFSSMAYEKTSGMMHNLGLFSNNINSYTYYPQTAVFNAFFSLKYIYDNNFLISEGSTYQHLDGNLNFEAFKNKYYLPLAFSVNKDVSEWDPLANSNPFEVQNDLVRLSTGYDGVLEKVDATNVECSNMNYISPSSVNAGTMFSADKTDTSQLGTVTVVIDVDKDGRYYVYAGSMRISGLKFTGGEDLSYSYNSSGIQPFVLDMGDRKAGDQIKVEFSMDNTNSSGMITFCAARLNQQLFDSAYQSIISNGTLKLDSFEESSLSGTIKVTNAESFIYTSIPYDESWHVYVDGEQLEYSDTSEDAGHAVVCVGNGLLGFGITRGEHRIEMKYIPRGIFVGGVITAVGAGFSVVTLLIVFALRKSKKNNNTVVLQETE